MKQKAVIQSLIFKVVNAQSTNTFTPDFRDEVIKVAKKNKVHIWHIVECMQPVSFEHQAELILMNLELQLQNAVQKEVLRDAIRAKRGA